MSTLHLIIICLTVTINVCAITSTIDKVAERKRR